ncbi:MAG: hypothetical protein AAFV93_16045, partial [Chloroflexota bacterium]
IIKALVLFALCNGIFVMMYPAEWLGNISLYGTLYPYRPRLPYGENPAQSYNISATNLPALLASHEIRRNKSDNEFRIVLIGDSNTWGWLLNNDETLSAQLNALDILVDSQDAEFYNLGYPIMSLTKDLLILDEAMHYQPDMIIWLVSLASFPPEQQFEPPLVQDNWHRLHDLNDVTFLERYADVEERFEPTLWDRTIIGQRRPLADLLRLQSYGVAWTATRIDQTIPEIIQPRQSDFDDDLSWASYGEPVTLSTDDLAFDVLARGVERAEGIPVIIINEPMFISDGQNSDVRYNSFYPRWAYDQYRILLSQVAEDNGWQVYDLWDTIALDEFTDSPVHLSANGTREFAQIIQDEIFDIGE